MISKHKYAVHLEKGKIREDGSYDDLIALDSRFAELVERRRPEAYDFAASDNKE